ncbi:MAG: biopolymer transporter ExbD [Crocinitomicaceae bacterium]|nr:biopolymer transporter ExbD [Crocinitomicaceae bacterium]
MAQIAESGGGDHGKGKKRAKKGSTHVDMTPMVDLAFLLLTFFVLTSTFSKPKVMPLAYPAKPKITDPVPPKANNVTTFVLAGDKVYYYRGEFYPKSRPGANGPTELTEANFGSGENSVRKLLASWNEYVIKNKVVLDKKLDKKQISDSIYDAKLNDLTVEREAVKVLIKTDDKALCKSFIDLVDELKIASIGVIAPTDLTAGEKELLKAKN